MASSSRSSSASSAPGAPAPADPYVQWLGLPPGPRPPDHYTLLGLPRFTSAPGQIAAATDVRVAAMENLLRVLGPADRPTCERLLGEIRTAGLVLRDPIRRQAYDARLLAGTAGTEIPIRPSRVTPQSSPTDCPPSNALYIIAGAAAGALILLVPAVLLWLNDPDPRPATELPAAPAAQPPTAAAPPVVAPRPGPPSQDVLDQRRRMLFWLIERRVVRARAVADRVGAVARSAAPILHRAVELEGHRRAARAAAGRGDYPAAAESLRRLLALGPTDPDAAGELQAVERQLYWADPRLWLRLADEAIAARPADADDATTLLAEAAFARAVSGDAAGAEQAIDRIPSVPANDATFAELCLRLADAGRTLEALQAFASVRDPTRLLGVYHGLLDRDERLAVRAIRRLEQSRRLTQIETKNLDDATYLGWIRASAAASDVSALRTLSSAHRATPVGLEIVAERHYQLARRLPLPQVIAEVRGLGGGRDTTMRDAAIAGVVRHLLSVGNETAARALSAEVDTRAGRERLEYHALLGRTASTGVWLRTQDLPTPPPYDVAKAVAQVHGWIAHGRHEEALSAISAGSRLDPATRLALVTRVTRAAAAAGETGVVFSAAAGVSDPAGRATVLLTAADAAARAGHRALASQCVDAARQLLAGLLVGRERVEAGAVLARALDVTGEIDAANAVADAVATDAQAVPNPAPRAWSLMTAARLLREQGRYDAMRAVLPRLVALFGERYELLSQWDVTMATMRTLADCGDAAGLAEVTRLFGNEPPMDVRLALEKELVRRTIEQHGYAAWGDAFDQARDPTRRALIALAAASAIAERQPAPPAVEPVAPVPQVQPFDR